MGFRLQASGFRKKEEAGSSTLGLFLKSVARSLRSEHGFSLLEVMVAVSILGLALTVILSAQGGLAASNKMAANMGMATSLSRCKMTELEEKMLKLGYPELDQIDSDIICCEGVDAPGFFCDTRVEKIMLPNPPDNSLGDGGFMSNPAALASGAASGSGLSGMPPIPGVISNPAGGPGLSLDVDAGLQNIGGQLQSQLSAMGGSQGLLSMVMGIVYPSLKPMLETSIRRVTVKVKWKEGPNQKDFAIVQYVTNPQRSGFVNGVPVGDGGLAPSAGGIGAPGMPGGAGVPGMVPGATPPVTSPVLRQ